MHVAAATSRESIAVLEAIMRLGGGVNDHDESGNMPLHIAAPVMSTLTIEFPVCSGVDPDATNQDGDTPLKSLEGIIQSLDDFPVAFGLLQMPPREVHVIYHRSHDSRCSIFAY